MKVVIDTNCLYASVSRKSKHFWLYEAFVDEEFDWIINNEILTEYREILSNEFSPKTSEVVTNVLLTAYNVIKHDPFYKWNLIHLDPDDNKFADLAISANADYLVSNDKDFRVLKDVPFPVVNVVTLDEFKEILER